MDDDWDLYAVVRGCAALTAASSALNATSGGGFSFQHDRSSQDLFEAPIRERFADQELQELHEPFIFKSSNFSQIVISPQSLPIDSPLSVLGGLQDLKHEQQQIRQKPQALCFANATKNPVPHNPSPRSKKRKNHMKKICHVAAENLSCDVWSWRKYGQKPIKGSPYPRGYYRCSTSKGCLARKQVERHRSDPGMFILTYTAEHNHPTPTHRNSLAGSTRQKQTGTPNSDDSVTAPFSPSTTQAASLSGAPEKSESSRVDLPEVVDDDDDDDFSISKMESGDDFFAGLEEFETSESGDCIFDNSPASVEYSWVSSTTVAGGG